jgi:hypothetical protein
MKNAGIYTYFYRREEDGKLIIQAGCSGDLKRRFSEHRASVAALKLGPIFFVEPSTKENLLYEESRVLDFLESHFYRLSSQERGEGVKLEAFLGEKETTAEEVSELLKENFNFQDDKKINGNINVLTSLFGEEASYYSTRPYSDFPGNRKAAILDKAGPNQKPRVVLSCIDPKTGRDFLDDNKNLYMKKLFIDSVSWNIWRAALKSYKLENDLLSDKHSNSKYSNNSFFDDFTNPQRPLNIEDFLDD